MRECLEHCEKHCEALASMQLFCTHNTLYTNHGPDVETGAVR